MLEQAIRFEGPSLVVSRQPCAMIDQREKRRRGEPILPYHVNPDQCHEKCNACIRLLGCPAISQEAGKAIIDPTMCTGCGLCAQICPYGAIVQE